MVSNSSSNNKYDEPVDINETKEYGSIQKNDAAEESTTLLNVKTSNSIDSYLSRRGVGSLVGSTFIVAFALSSAAFSLLSSYGYGYTTTSPAIDIPSSSADINNGRIVPMESLTEMYPEIGDISLEAQELQLAAYNDHFIHGMTMEELYEKYDVGKYGKDVDVNTSSAVEGGGADDRIRPLGRFNCCKDRHDSDSCARVIDIDGEGWSCVTTSAEQCSKRGYLFHATCCRISLNLSAGTRNFPFERCT